MSKVNLGIMAAAFRAAGIDPVAIAAATAMAAGMCRFALIKYSCWSNKTWVKVLGDGQYEYVNGVREWTPKDLIVIETVYAKSFLDLDWKKSTYWRPGDAGWLSPEGRIWPCNYEGHCNLAENILGKTYSWLEENGWVHVDHAGEKGCKSYRLLSGNGTGVLREPTEAQLKWLSDNGHDITYHGHGEKAKPVATFEVGGYTLDAEAEWQAFQKYMALAPKR